MAGRLRARPQSDRDSPRHRARQTVRPFRHGAGGQRSVRPAPASGGHRTPISFASVVQESHTDLRRAVRDLCRSFPDAYWRELDSRRAYPEAFVKALTDAGYLAALIPEAYG